VRCGNEFSAAANRAYPNVIVEAFSAKWLWTKITDSALVSCPRCDHGFQSDQVRFFGVLSLRQSAWCSSCALLASWPYRYSLRWPHGEVSNKLA
jgi:hypothetical protein